MGHVAALGHRAGQSDQRLPQELIDLIEPDFSLVDGPHYLDVLADLHKALKPEWYLEIGTNRGRSLVHCLGNFVAVDPKFVFENFAMKSMAEGHFLQSTSDDFFASGFLERNEIRPDLGFLDGLHLFEFLLRDFMNFERRASSGAMAILHDCLPYNNSMEARDWDQALTKSWSGDVWKTLVILQDHRPDLKIQVLDAFPTGLVMVSGLDPENRVLDKAYDDIVAQYSDVRLRDFGVTEFFDRFEIESSYHYLKKLHSA